MEGGAAGIEYKPMHPLQKEYRSLLHVLAVLSGDCHLPDDTADNQPGILQGMRHLR
jgi:hypothetical protein